MPRSVLKVACRVHLRLKRKTNSSRERWEVLAPEAMINADRPSFWGWRKPGGSKAVTKCSAVGPMLWGSGQVPRRLGSRPSRLCARWPQVFNFHKPFAAQCPDPCPELLHLGRWLAGVPKAVWKLTTGSDSYLSFGGRFRRCPRDSSFCRTGLPSRTIVPALRSSSGSV